MIRNHFLVLFLLFAIVSLFAQKHAAQDILITLERNPGYFGQIGTVPCPFYKLTIFADGKVELEPKEYGQEKIITGRIIKSHISKMQLKQLISEFEKAGFNSLKSTFENPPKELFENVPSDSNDCPQYGTDGVTAITSITLKGKTKTVEHYHGCQGNESLSKLTALENKIDEIVNVKQWFDCYRGENRIKLPI